jgi:hypothetical protein
MEKMNERLNQFLPYGESLRAILQHPSISKADKRKLLRVKGIFVNEVDDDTAFPFLTTSLLSPVEFEFLKEKLKAREDREKTITRTLDWESDKSLFDALPAQMNVQEIIKTNFPRYNLVGNPNFVMVEENPNKVALVFKCETENYGKDWFRASNEFEGQIMLERVTTSDNKVQLQIVHTSPETTDLSNKVVKHLENHFKAISCMNPASEIQRVLYRDFTNEERIKFLLSFTVGNHVFSFEKACYLDIGHDPNETLPEDINWMELAKVNELNINGDGLQEIHFIKDSSLHRFMELCEIELLYNFSLPSAEGNCKIKFGFHGYLPKRVTNIEFVTDIGKINFAEGFDHVLEKNVRSSLLKEFDRLKNEKIKLLRASALVNS